MSENVGLEIVEKMLALAIVLNVLADQNLKNEWKFLNSTIL